MNLNHKLCLNQKHHYMNKKYSQLLLVLFALLEVLFVINAFTTNNFLYQQFYTGLSVIFLLLIIRLISNQNYFIYGNNNEQD